MDQWNKPLLGSRIDWGHPLSRGLVGCWLMNENSGNRIYDISLNGNDGILVGDPEWVPGHRGQEISFDGTDTEYVNCGDDSVFDTTGSLTVSAWVYKNSDTVFSIMVAKGGGLVLSEYMLRFNNTGKAMFAIYVTGPLFKNAQSSVVATGERHHIVGMYDETNVKIYIDGVETIGQATSAAILTNTNDVIIGKDDSIVNRDIDGTIDDVRIWNRALSAQEVQDLYINPYGMILSPQPKVYYIANDALYQFTSEHMDTHFVAESIDRHFVAEGV